MRRVMYPLLILTPNVVASPVSKRYVSRAFSPESISDAFKRVTMVPISVASDIFKTILLTDGSLSLTSFIKTLTSARPVNRSLFVPTAWSVASTSNWYDIFCSKLKTDADKIVPLIIEKLPESALDTIE